MVGHELHISYIFYGKAKPLAPDCQYEQQIINVNKYTISVQNLRVDLQTVVEFGSKTKTMN